eukprot:2212307-Rhodomonas_salina.1
MRPPPPLLGAERCALEEEVAQGAHALRGALPYLPTAPCPISLLHYALTPYCTIHRALSPYLTVAYLPAYPCVCVWLCVCVCPSAIPYLHTAHPSATPYLPINIPLPHPTFVLAWRMVLAYLCTDLAYSATSHGHRG